MSLQIDRTKLTKEECDRLDELETIAKAHEAPEPEPEPVIPEAVQKMLDETKVAMAKMADENKTLAAQLQKAEEARELTNFIAKAATDFPTLPGTADDKGKLLQFMSKGLDKTNYDAAMALLKAGDEAMRLVVTGSTSGTDDAVRADSALGQMEVLAKELITSGKAKSLPEAMDLVAQANPALFVQHQKETRRTE